MVTLFHTTVTLCQKWKTILPFLLYFSTENIPKNSSLLNIDLKTWGLSVWKCNHSSPTESCHYEADMALGTVRKYFRSLHLLANFGV